MTNFYDPFGLLRRMLSSGNPIAHSVLLREFLGIAATPFDLALRPAERRRLRRQPPGDPPVILFTGGPRRGTTITYQLLARYLPVSYISNWVGAFRWSPISAGCLLRRTTENYRGTAQSYFGNSAGLGGPNDGFNVWNRWLGTERRTVLPITDEAALEMQQFFAAWHAAFGKPHLNKHNRLVLCIARVAEILSNATIVIVHRDPVFMAQSLIEARSQIQGDVKHAWGLLGREANAVTAGNPIIAVCEQVNDIHARMAEQLAATPPERLCIVRYEELCRDPLAVLRDVATKARLPQPIQLPPDIEALQDTNASRLPDEVLDEIREHVVYHDFAEFMSSSSSKCC
jgi:hypothetical protein